VRKNTEKRDLVGRVNRRRQGEEKLELPQKRSKSTKRGERDIERRKFQKLE